MWGKGWRFMNCRVRFAIKQQGWIYNSSPRIPKCLNLIKHPETSLPWCFQVILSNQFMFPFCRSSAMTIESLWLLLVGRCRCCWCWLLFVGCCCSSSSSCWRSRPWSLPPKTFWTQQLSRIPWPLSNVNGGRGSLQTPRWRTASPPPVKINVFQTLYPKTAGKWNWPHTLKDFTCRKRMSNFPGKEWEIDSCNMITWDPQANISCFWHHGNAGFGRDPRTWLAWVLLPGHVAQKQRRDWMGESWCEWGVSRILRAFFGSKIIQNHPTPVLAMYFGCWAVRAALAVIFILVPPWEKSTHGLVSLACSPSLSLWDSRSLSF